MHHLTQFSSTAPDPAHFFPNPCHRPGQRRNPLYTRHNAASCGPSPSNGRGTGADGFFHAFPTVTAGAQPQGDHCVHTGVVFNGQMPANVLHMGIIGRGRVAGPKVRHREHPLGLSFLGLLRVLIVNPSGQSQRRIPGAPQLTASPGDSPRLPADVSACGFQNPAHGGDGCSRTAFCRHTPGSGVP